MPCPICSKPTNAEVKPFCSGRCQQVDLSRWFGERYTVAAEANDEEDDTFDMDADGETQH